MFPPNRRILFEPWSSRSSLSRQLVNALLCALTRQGLKGETNKGKLKISDLTVTFGAETFGAGGGEAKVSYFSNSFGSMDKLTEHLAKLDVAVVNLGRHYNKHSAGGRNEAAYAQRVHQHAAACVKFGSRLRHSPPAALALRCRV